MSLTATEATARSTLLTVSHYDLHLDLTEFEDTGRFRTHTTIRFLCSEPGGATWVDLVAREVTRAQLNGVELHAGEVFDGERLALTDLAEYNLLIVESVHDAGTGRGLSRSVDTSDGTTYAWTQFQPYDARRAFACFDQPDLKAPFRITAVAPRAWTCVSNGVAKVAANGNGTRTWTFSETPPLPSYVVALCGGPFHVVDGRAGDVTIRLHCRRTLAPLLERDAADLLDLTRRGLEFFGREFGQPYASTSYDYVFLPDQPGAMENFGCVTWGDGALYRVEPTDAQRERRASVLLHEMAHMWFGNLVTPDWWDGLWLNESFASWAGTWAACELSGGSTDPWARFLMTHKSRAYIADEGPTSHAVSVPIVDVDAAEANFDMITYVKGTSVLRQLVAWLGEQQFVDGLRRYFKRYAWQNADLAALLEELAAGTGRDLHSWAEQWLREPGVNTLEVLAPTDGGRYGDVVIEQTGGTLRPHRLQVGVYDRLPSGELEARETLELDVTGTQSPVRTLVSAHPAAVLLPNDGDLTFAKVRLDPDSARGLLEGAHTIAAPLSRAVAVTVLRSMVLDAELAASGLVHVALRCAEREADAATINHLIDTAHEAATLFSAAERRTALLEQIADVCLRGCQTATAPATRRAYAIGLARSAISDTQFDELTSLGGDTDLRWTALTRLAAADRFSEAALTELLDHDPDPEAPLRATCVHAARPDGTAKAHALERLLTDKALPVTVLHQLADALWQPEHEELLRPFAQQYLEALPDLLADAESAALRNVVGYTFPLFGPDEELLAFARRVEAGLNVSRAARNSLQDKTWLLERALHARAVQDDER